MAALDGDLDRIIAAGPGSFVETAEAARLDATFGHGILELRGGVKGQVAIDKDVAEVLAVDGDDGFPLHVRGDIDLVRHGALAGCGIAGVDDNIGIDLALPRVRGEIHEVDAEVDATVTAGGGGTTVAEGEGHDVARVVRVVARAVNVGATAAVAFVVFVEHEKIGVPPLREGADGDRPFAAVAAAAGRLGRMRAGGQLLRVGEAVAIRIAGRAIVGVAIAGRAGAEAVRPVVERIETVLRLPAIGQTVIVGVGIERVGFGPRFAGIVNTIAVGVAVDDSVEVFVFTEAVAQTVFIGIRLVRTGFGPSFEAVDFVVGPIAGVGAVGGERLAGGSERERLAVAVGPAVAVLVLDAVADAVVIVVGLVRIGRRTGSLARAIVALALRADARHKSRVGDHGIKRRIEVADEVGDAVRVAVDPGHGRRNARNAPSNFQRVRQTIAVGIGAGGQCVARSIPDVHIAVGPGLGLRLRKIALVRLDIVDQPVVVVVIVLNVVAGNDLAEDDARVAHGGGRLAVERRRGVEQITAGRGDAPSVVPRFGVAHDGDVDSVAHPVAVGVGERLGWIAGFVVVEIEEVFAGVELVVAVDVGVGLGRVPLAVRIRVRVGIAIVPNAVAVDVGRQRFRRIPLVVAVDVGGRLLGVPAPVRIAVGVSFLEDGDGGRGAEHEVVDRRTGLDPHHVIERVRTGSVFEDQFGRAAVGTELGRAGDADERFGARIGLDQTQGIELAVVGEGVGDGEGVEEARHVVVKIGQRDGQLVEGVADVVVDVEIAAALGDGIAVGAALGARDGEGEAVDQLVFVRAVVVGIGCFIGERFGEVDLQRVVVIDPVAIALRPGDIDPLVGPAGLDGARDRGDVGGGGGQIDVARRRSFVQADGDGRLAVRRNIVVTEAPFFFAREVD